ncbi:MAG: SRPBCC family protein [Burkholderiales bacterium]|nr:SRPBCC family protein [Burkholderiales bacterium]MDE2502357.1 SRPBCC family protein [Burkholderiales bacterium]
MLRPFRCAALLMAAALLWPAGVPARASALPSAAPPPLVVDVDKEGPRIIIDVQARVAADPQLTWQVLTDYDHMADFLSLLQSSHVVAGSGPALEVEQVGQAHRAFLHYTFHSRLAIGLDVDRHRIEGHLIDGDFKRFDFWTRVTALDDGGSLITHHGEYIPDAWVPPGIGPVLIRAETRRQYEELIAEVLRRRDAARP